MLRIADGSEQPATKSIIGHQAQLLRERKVGAILAVRRCAATAELIAFVRYKDLARRFAEWVPVDALDTSSLPESYHGRIDEPEPNVSYIEPIPAEIRRSFKSTIDFLEERLRRDMLCPNSFRNMYYLGAVMTPWYYSPLEVLYPQFRASSPEVYDAYVCPFTLTFLHSESMLQRHLAAHLLDQGDRALHPPGKEVYCDAVAGLSIYEVKGVTEPVYCRNLFLLSKCFLENKLVGHETDIYTFYVLAVHAQKWAPSFLRLPEGMKGPKYFAGYYSYENGSISNNLACIVTLPCFQGRGFGRFLIAASYAIGYKKGIIGSPERPLSDLGRAAYDKYWAERIWRWADRRLLSLETDPTATIRPGNFDPPPSASDPEKKGFVTFATLHTDADSISRALKLDPADVKETLLRLGLIHRGSDDGLLKVVIPVDLAKRSMAKAATTAAPFRSALLSDVAPRDG